MNQQQTTTAVTIDDAHTFAQALIADGWHNDSLDCVDALQRRLEAFLSQRAMPAAAPVGKSGIEAWCTGMPLPDDTVVAQGFGKAITVADLAELDAMITVADGERARFITAALRNWRGPEANAMDQVDDGTPLSADPDQARKQLIARVDAARQLFARGGL